MKHWIFVLSLLILGCFALFFAISKRSDCFSPSFVTCEKNSLPLEIIQEPLTPNDQVTKILQQPFTFLGSGNQSYAFLSQDGKYVLKLMKIYQTQNEPQKLKRLINGFQVAYQYDQKHTGILYIHLKPTHFSDFSVNLTDKAGRKHKLDLNPLLFALQLKAVPTNQIITKHLKNGEIQAARVKLEAILTMMQEEHQMGVLDKDHNIWHNTGFIGDKPIRIDVGKLELSPEMKKPEISKNEIDKVKNDRMIPWIHRYFPGQKIF